MLLTGACDLGLPDSEICSGLSTPPAAMDSLTEAWSRGWVTPLSSSLAAEQAAQATSDRAMSMLRCSNFAPDETMTVSCPSSILACNPVHLGVRRRWLLGLLVLQSSSSFVLNSYETLLKEHIFVTLFLVTGRTSRLEGACAVQLEPFAPGCTLNERVNQSCHDN